MIKRAILSSLKRAGQEGLTLKGLAKRTGLKPRSVSAWLYNNLDCTPKIGRVERGLYVYRSEAEIKLLE